MTVDRCIFRSGEVYLFHGTNPECPARSSLWGMFDVKRDGVVYLESSTRNGKDFALWHPLPARYRFCRLATKIELRDYILALVCGHIADRNMDGAPSAGRKEEIPYRFHRIAAVQAIDRLYFENGDMQHTHKMAYKLFLRPMFGICANTALDDRRHPREELENYRLPPYIESTLAIMVLLVKRSSVADATAILRYLRSVVSTIVGRDRLRRLDLELFRKYLAEAVGATDTVR